LNIPALNNPAAIVFAAKIAISFHGTPGFAAAITAF
jgi:hypothetical protein